MLLFKLYKVICNTTINVIRYFSMHKHSYWSFLVSITQLYFCVLPWLICFYMFVFLCLFSYDFVEVEEKSGSSTIKWGRWCGQKAPSSLTSKFNTLRITFKSDDYFVAKPGFKIYYSLLVRKPQILVLYLLEKRHKYVFNVPCLFLPGFHYDLI